MQSMTIRPGRVEDETPDGRRHRARTLAGFFAAGAAVSTLAVVLPGWSAMHRPGILVTVVLAAGGAGLLAMFGARAGRGSIHGMTVCGTALIAACQVLAGGGSATATYGLLYIWVILHCALFFGRRVVALQLALTTCAQVVALVWLGDLASIAPQLALTVGTQIAAALVVGSLAAKMRRLADTDALTGLDNRRALERALDWHMARARRIDPGSTWVALLDLNEFKAYNDRHGHAAGDLLLAEAATAWRQLLRETDSIARTGGDEFTLLLSDCRADQAEQIVARMAAAVPEGVSCSVGLARWNGHETAAELIQRADAALYLAKEDGPVVVAEHLEPVPADSGR